MKIRRSIATALAALAALSAQAAPVTYRLDRDHTFPRFTYDHLGYSIQLGRFDRTTGTVVLDKEARTASVDVTIDVKSVNTGTALDEHLRGPDFFDTARFPTATFKSTRVVFEGDRPATIEGELTLKGVTRPVSLKVTSFKAAFHPMHRKDAVGAMASTTIRRSDFGVDKYVPLVSDEVHLEVAIEAVRE